MFVRFRGGADPHRQHDTQYQYDPVGNRLTKQDGGAVTAYQYNQANALTMITPPTGAPTTLSWDANGNLLKEEAGASVTDYQWGPENHLTQVSGPGGTESYLYREDGKRVRNETSGGSTGLAWTGRIYMLRCSEKPPSWGATWRSWT